MNKYQRDPLLLPLCEDMARSWQFATQKTAFAKTRSCWHSDLRLPASRNVRNKYLLFTSTQSVEFCYIIAHRLRQRASAAT